MEFRIGENLFGATFCAAHQDTVYVKCYLNDENGITDPDRTFIVAVSPDETRFLGYFDYDTTSLTVHNGALHLADVQGNLHIWRGDTWQIETTPNDGRHYFTKVKDIGGTLFGLGTDLGLARLVGTSWETVLGKIRGISLTDIERDASGDLWVSGSKGTFGKVVDGTVNFVELPVNTTINSLLAYQDGLVLTGAKALAGLYRGEELRFFDRGDRTLTIYNSTIADNELFFSATFESS